MRSFAALLVAACAETGSAPKAPAATAATLNNEEAVRGAMVVSFLHQADKRSIDLATIAKARADSPQIVRFADELLTDHQQMDDLIVTFARDHGIDFVAVSERVKQDVQQQLDDRRVKSVGSATGEWAFTAEPRIDPTAAQLAIARFNAAQDKLRIENGAAFSRDFVQAVIDDHQVTLDRIAHAMGQISDPAVKSLVNGLVPICERHLAEAQRLQDRLSKS
jgi:predicted outer membrane protein